MYDVNSISKELKGWDNGIYFGQWKTDEVIEGYFNIDVPGVCVEVGAANGIKGSNSLYFEQRGWNVLCIEPNPEHFESLNVHRKNNLMLACGDKVAVLPLTIFRVGERDISTSITSLSPDERLIESHKDLINRKYEVEVKVKKLSDILESDAKLTDFGYQDSIDFISVDTEGTELQVLKGFDFEKYDVKLFVVENNYDDADIRHFMLSKGYRRDQRYKINDFYVREDF